MIFHSTGLFAKSKTSSIVRKLISNKVYNIELSAGAYEKNIVNYLIKKKRENSKINFLIHNYFPPSRKPFVLNLSSGNKEIRKKSIKLAMDAIKYMNEKGIMQLLVKDASGKAVGVIHMHDCLRIGLKAQCD